MKVLFLGGTGIISMASVKLAVDRGYDVSILNRGNKVPYPGSSQIVCDVNDQVQIDAAIKEATWDVVVDFVSFKLEDVERRIQSFEDRVKQFFFISSASVYQRPCRNYLITESTPLANPFWKYSRDKIECEERLTSEHRERGFPVVIVRPALTFGNTQIPLVMNCWEKPFTAIHRLRSGKPLIIPGDGSSLWTITHNTDFAYALLGLFGNENAIGHAFHITSDEVLTWDQIYQATAEAASVCDPEFIHISSDFITACLPDHLGSLIGDKASSVVLDNAKIKSFVPDFVVTTRFAERIKQTLSWFDSSENRRAINKELDDRYDKLIHFYKLGLAEAKAAFRQ